MKTLTAVILLSAMALYAPVNANAGAADLAPVDVSNWALKIVVFDVGQGDATVLLTPDAQAAIVDMGKTKAHGSKLVNYLLNQSENGVASIHTVEFLFVSHYDSDHIGGVRRLKGNIQVKAAYDQGPSAARNPKNPKGVYTAYVNFVGDKNGDGIQGPSETQFVRHKAEPSDPEFSLGPDGNVKIRTLSVRGDTAGADHDLLLAPNKQDSDENPGSLIQLVTLGEFAYLTTGDTTSDDWKKKPDPEEAMILANAIPGDRIDVLKVPHHGSDTSSGQLFIRSTRPRIAIISTDRTHDKLPKLTSLKVLEQNDAKVLVTGRATTKKGKYHQSAHKFDNGYVPTNTTDRLGTITIWVANDGSKFTVRSEKNPQLTITRSSTDL